MAKRRSIRRFRQASADLGGIWKSIAPDNPRAADRVVERIAGSIETLGDFAFIGRPRGDVSPGLRALFVEPYLVFYIVTDETVDIIRIVHAARDVHRLKFGRSNPYRR